MHRTTKACTQLVGGQTSVSCKAIPISTQECKRLAMVPLCPECPGLMLNKVSRHCLPSGRDTLSAGPAFTCPPYLGSSLSGQAQSRGRESLHLSRVGHQPLEGLGAVKDLPGQVTQFQRSSSNQTRVIQIMLNLRANVTASSE
jgi:hypothetical protein